MNIRPVDTYDGRELIELLNTCFNSNTVFNYTKYIKWLMIQNKYCFVGIEDNRIVATYTVIIDHKLIHNFGKVARGEDLAVHPDYRGKGLGKQMMKYIENFCKDEGVYKFIAATKRELVETHRKYLGCREHEVSLRRDFD